MNCTSACNSNSSLVLIQMVVYIPVFITGSILNILALWVFCCKLSKWTATRVYMTNLAIADFLFLITLPFKIMFRVQNWKTPVCLFLESAYFINRYMSIFLITITAVDRHMAIKYPLKAKHVRSPLKSAVACGVLWVIMISIVCVTKYSEVRMQPIVCFRKCSIEPSKPAFASVIWGFVIPLTILSFCSIQSTKKLMRKKETHPNEKKLIQKAINIIFANMAVFIICFLPLHVAHFVRFIADSMKASCIAIHNIAHFLQVAGIIANTNCCFDAICYYLVNKEFQEASEIKYWTRTLNSEII
ncbi:G-protein coupled receptor 35-like isoform X3 [Hemicordylus capensis]|nr:G-protein coupled receptor 35-like isoform X3 [Hemicordylus capensis]XP_053160465.1 G-protein coupled receptor 35-like isoform X3 [Hemicordylus capensis]XP_053160466.1 G-protein coupled receptor 35-like isoform X3 [Hemicordylus capensis]